jgi:tyrosine-protein phosphatase YwqE
VRRGDFQYDFAKVSGEELYNVTRRFLSRHTTVYIATDERNKQEYFGHLMDRYDVIFLDDFMDELEGVNSNYYGMVRSHFVFARRPMF